MTAVHNKLTEAPGDEIKKGIGQCFFGDRFDSLGGLDAFGDYFKYYQEEIDWMCRGVTADTDQLTSIAIRTHDDLMTVAAVIRDNIDKNRPEIRAELRKSQSLADWDDLSLNRAIDLTLKLWLQINTWDDDYAEADGPERQWDETTTLSTFVMSFFPVADLDIGAKERRMDASFTVANMVEICELKVEWTNNLDDHLQLDRQRRVVSIFPYKCCLQALLPRPGSSSKSPLSDTLVKETIMSLNLLFPFWDEQTRRFLEKQRQTFHQIIGPAEQGRSLDLLAFSHWRERLFILYGQIYLSPPDTWERMKKDKRDPQMYYTFWFAWYILWLTVVSTAASVVSMIVGVVQLWMAVVAVKQSGGPVTCILSPSRNDSMSS